MPYTVIRTAVDGPSSPEQELQFRMFLCSVCNFGKSSISSKTITGVRKKAVEWLKVRKEEFWGVWWQQGLWWAEVWGQEDGWEAAPGHGGALRGSSNESLGWGTRWTCSAGSVPLRQSGPDLGEIRENTPVGFGRFWDGVLKSSKKINRISAVLMWAS